MGSLGHDGRSTWTWLEEVAFASSFRLAPPLEHYAPITETEAHLYLITAARMCIRLACDRAPRAACSAQCTAWAFDTPMDLALRTRVLIMCVQ